jgi:hypothetical protein
VTIASLLVALDEAPHWTHDLEPGLDVTGESVSECRPTEHAGGKRQC